MEQKKRARETEPEYGQHSDKRPRHEEVSIIPPASEVITAIEESRTPITNADSVVAAPSTNRVKDSDMIVAHIENTITTKTSFLTLPA